jgi:hypothetical protein
MPSSTKNVKLGVCKVFFNGEDLGYTKGGVEFSVATMTYRIEVDQFGKTAINEFIMGRDAKVKVPLAETTLENMAAMFPLRVGAVGIEGTTNKRLGVDTGIGADLLSTSKLLSLHPVSLNDFDFSDEVIIPLANTPGALQFAYQLENERIFNVEFTGYPDPLSNMLFYAGNPFTDAVLKTFTVTSMATTVLTVSTGLTNAMTGKMVMLAAVNATGAFPTGVVGRRLYYMKFISATTCSLHLSYDAAIAGTGAVSVGTGSFAAGVSMALLS